MDDLLLPPPIETDSSEVTTDGLEELIYKVCAFTGMNYEASEIIVRYFFQELLNMVLIKEKTVILSRFGIFSLITPKLGLKKVFFKFKPSSYLKKVVNA